MEAEVLAVVDSDRDYLEKFTEFFQQKYGETFECRSFTCLERLLEYGLDHRVSILLLSEELYEDSVKRINAGKVFLLSEESGEGEDGCKRIDRFRPADGILREVMKARADSDEPVCRAGRIKIMRFEKRFS